MWQTVLTKSSFIFYSLSKKSNEISRLRYACVKFFVLFVVVFQSFIGFSQQDCAGAIPVCQQTYVQPNSYSGFGNTQEIFNTCLINNEQASVWYVFTVQTAGTFFFNINTANDYDWALYNLTGTSCANIPNMTPVRCNYSATYGNTGMVSPASATGTISYDATNTPTMPGMNVTVGQTYALIVDNYTQDQNGYTLTFSGTSTFLDVTAPTFTSNTNNCYGNYVTITLSENVTCGSIAANGSDFQISGPGSPSIVSAVGVGCPGSGTTNQVQVYYSASGSGQFTVTSKVGNDGNTILDRCGNALAVGQTAVFNHLGTVTASASPSAICSGASTTLTVTGPASGGTYAWSNGATTTSTTVSPTSTTTYTVTVSYGGCTKTSSTTVTIAANPVVSISPQNAVVCSGATVDLTATSLVNGVSCSNCNYNWTSGPTQNGVPSSVWTGRGIGSYTVTVTTSAGCTGTATTTISGPSANPASCNVIFASPSGGGTGLSAGSPTTLPIAITMAACNNAVIKLQIGTYTIDSPLSIFSAMTIEGGYNVGYTTKSSLAGATTITRSALNVEGLPDAGRLVAFQAQNQSYFRLQDITITTATPTAASPLYPKGVSTYALYLSSCNNYDIVRCQLLPGAASDGLIGSAGTAGANGGAGGTGLAGSADNQGLDRLGGAGGSSPCGCLGGAGGRNQRDGASSTAGTQGSCGGGAGGARGSGNNCSFLGCSNPDDGSNGSNGTSVSTIAASGSMGPAGSIIGSFWNPGGQGLAGATGGNGTGGGGGGGGAREAGTLCDDGAGASGSGGGGGGCGGTGGTGGWGGGSSYSLFLVSNGANGRVVDCNVTPGAAGTGGAGGTGGSGGTGGLGGPRIDTDCDIGAGGAGGNGGNGGQGGTGGVGSPGESVGMKFISGTPLVTNTSLNLAAQPTITASNISCTNTNIAHTGGVASAFTDFGTNASPASNSLTTQYSTTGRKTIVMSGNTYTDFTNILISASLVTPSIITASTTICPGTANFTASTISQSGLTYSWSVTNPAGGSSTITSATNGSTDISFTNTGTTSLTYTVNLTITSSCCGTLGSVSLPIVVLANPILSTPANTTVCVGGNTSFSSNVTGSGANGQWQVSLDGVNWSNITASSVYSNVTSSPLSLTGVTAGMNGLLYRYTVVGPCGLVSSNPATLSINTPPTATVSASPTNVCSVTNQSSTLTFTFTGSAPWTVTYNTVTASGTTTSTFTTSNNPHTISVTPSTDVSYTITSVYTVLGCANTTLTGTAVNVTTAMPNVVVSSNTVTGCGNVNLTSLVLPPPTSTLDGPLTYSPTSTPTSVGSGTYTISNTNACGTSSQTVSVTVLASPTLTITPSSTICNGTTVTLSTTVSVGGGTYLWSPGGQTTSSITVNPSSTTTYGVTYTPPGCSPITASSTITVRPTPSAFISGTTSVCRNATQPTITFTNPNADQVLVTYQINGSGSFSVGVNGNSTANVSVPTSTVGTYTYTITSVQFQSGTPNCSITQTGSATVTVTPLPTVSISGGATVCQNASSPFVTFTNTNSAAVLASYTVNGTPATVVVPANGTATVGVNTATSGTITYALTGVAFNTAGGCTNTASGSAIFTIVALPTVSISGTTSVCQGASSPNISISNPNSTAVTVTYNLTGNPNQTMVINAGATGTIAVSTASTGTFTYNLVSVTLNSGAGCSASVSGSATVTVIQTPSVSISGDATVCQGATAPTVTFTNFSAIAVSVDYTIGTNSNTINIPASGTNTVTAPTSTAGTYVYTLESVNYTSGNACNSSVSGSISVVVLPLPTATLSGSETICENGSPNGFTITNPRPYDEQVTYTFTGGSSQTVSVPANGTYTIYPAATPSGTFTYSLTSVSYSNYSTCTSALSGQTATLTILPAPTVTISGTTSLCVNGPTSTVTFTNPSLTNAIVVTYNLNGNPSTTINVSANATSTVTVSTTTAGTFTYTLENVSYTGSNACASAVTGSAVVTVNALPTGSISGTATVCQNDITNVTFTNTSNAEVVITYALGGSNSTVNVPANSTNTIAVPTGTAGTYTYNLVSIAYASGSACTQTLSGQAIVTVNPAPTATLTTSVSSACLNASSPTITVTNPQALPITVYYSIFDGTTTTGPFSVNVSGNNSTQLSVPTTSAVTYTYSITSVAYQSGGGCTNTGVTSVVNMQITAPPTITNTAVSVCSGTTLNIPLTSNPSGATYEWSASNNINVTGETVSPTQTSSTITDILVATNVVNVTYNIIPTLNGCQGTASTLIVTVSPPPTAPTIGTVTHPTCATPTGTIALSGLPATGTWTVTGNPSGTATGTGTTGSVSGLAPGSYTFTVANASGCNSVASASVTVNAAPTTIATPTLSNIPGEICPSGTTITVNGLAGSIVSYTVNGATATPTNSVTLNTAGQANIALSNPTANVVITLTNITSGGCGGPINVSTTITYNSGCVGFTECNLLVFTNGDGLTTNARPVTIEQINPTNGAISNNNYSGLFTGSNLLTALTNQTSHGFMNSFNGQLAVPGINASVGTGTATFNPKVVNVISSSATLATPQVVFPVTGSQPYFNLQFRSVIPGTVPNSFYCAGGQTPASALGGVWYYDGNGNFIQICNSTSPPTVNFGNVRSIEIFNGELYVTTSSSPAGIYKIGSGLPVTAGQTATPVITGYTNASPNGFSISPDGCTIYIADDGNSGNINSRGILKFIKTGSTWSTTPTYKYTAYTRGLVVDYSGSLPKIFATIAPNSSNPCNQIIAVEDNGSSMSLLTGFTTQTAATNYRYSGIDFTPNSYKPITISTQPLAINACAGSVTPLTVVATSTGSLTYEWFRRNADDCSSLAVSQGAPSSSPNFTPTSSGFYFVKIVASCASVAVSNTVQVTITQPATATLSSGTYCQTSTTPVNLIPVTTGNQGVPTWDGGGLVNFNNGTFTPSESPVNTYTVTYTIPQGACPEVVTTATIIITNAPSATISYSGSPFCSSASSQAVIQTGDAGGVYSATPSGLSINSITGAINPGASTSGGPYTVSYTLSGGGCATVVANATVSISQAPTATINYSGPFCGNLATAQSVNLSGTLGGTFTSSPSGLILDATTGAITPSTSTAGTYTVTYTLPAANGCPIFTTSTSITISSLPTVTATLSSTSSCNGGTLTLTGGPSGMNAYSWSGPAGATFSPNAFTQSPSVIMGSTAGTFTLTVTDASGCSNSATTAAVTINPSPTVVVNCNNICVGTSTTVSATPNPAGTYSYTWTVPSGVPAPGNVQSFTTSVAGQYSVIVTNTATTCPSVLESCTISTFTLPSIIFLSPP